MDGVRYCSLEEYATCAVPTEIELALDSSAIEACGCPKACSTATYSGDLSSQPLSDVSRDALVDYVQSELGCPNPEEPFCDRAYSQGQIEKSFIQLEVYFATLTSESVEERPSYTILALLCDIGGALGLILGSTILTVIEFLDFFAVATSQALLVRSAKLNAQADSPSSTPPKWF